MTDSHRRSFTFFLFLGLLLFVTVPSTARPTTTLYHNQYDRRRPTSTQSTTVTTIPSDLDDTQTIETAQVFTMFGGNTTEICILIHTPTTLANGDAAIIFSKNCTFSFTPSSISPSTVTSVTSTSELLTIIVTSKAFMSTDVVSLSMFTTAGLPTSTFDSVASPTPTTVTSDTISPNATVSTPTPPLSTVVNTPVNDPVPFAVSRNPLSLSSQASATLASSTSSSDPFTSTAQSHLSSLPIFLGAFGGIAGLALLVVGFKVYRPMQRLNEMRLHPPAFMRRLRKGSDSWNIKRWPRMGEHDSEKLTASQSQETVGQTSRGSSEVDSQVSGWIS